MKDVYLWQKEDKQDLLSDIAEFGDDELVFVAFKKMFYADDPKISVIFAFDYTFINENLDKETYRAQVGAEYVKIMTLLQLVNIVADQEALTNLKTMGA